MRTCHWECQKYGKLERTKEELSQTKETSVAEIFSLEVAEKGLEEFVVTYNIKTESPVFPENNGETAYWRSGGYIPDNNNGQVFKVSADFPDETTAEERESYFKSFYIKSDESWFH